MSKRLFIDTNILLDHLLDRQPFADDATEIWSMSERGQMVGCVSAISFNFVYYIVRHASNERTAKRAIKSLRDIFEIVEVDAQIINQAIDSGFKDFEDGIQHACAVRAGAQAIITRNLADFKKSEVPVLAPNVYLATVGESR
ncbi:MAG: type II toxin-antitoxin system VapC family toxin [Phycisphaeraceae bacterium JB051]